MEELDTNLRGAEAKASSLEKEMEGLRQKQEGKASSILSLCWKLARTKARLSTLEKENSGLNKALEADAEAFEDEEVRSGKERSDEARIIYKRSSLTPCLSQGQIAALKAENLRLKLDVEAARKAAGKEGEGLEIRLQLAETQADRLR